MWFGYYVDLYMVLQNAGKNQRRPQHHVASRSAFWEPVSKPRPAFNPTTSLQQGNFLCLLAPNPPFHAKYNSSMIERSLTILPTTTLPLEPLFRSITTSSMLHSPRTSIEFISILAYQKLHPTNHSMVRIWEGGEAISIEKRGRSHEDVQPILHFGTLDIRRKGSQPKDRVVSHPGHPDVFTQMTS